MAKTLCERKGCNDYHATSQHDIIAGLRRPPNINIDKGNADNSKVTWKENEYKKRANIAEVMEDKEVDMNDDLEAYECSMRQDDDLEIFNSTHYLDLWNVD